MSSTYVSVQGSVMQKKANKALLRLKEEQNKICTKTIYKEMFNLNGVISR